MSTPGVYIVEHKTTSFDIGFGSTYWKRLTLDAQISKYLVGARALGHEPIGVIYDVIKKPALRPLEATPVEKRKYTEPSSKACPECKKKKSTIAAPHSFTADGEIVDSASPSAVVTCADGRVVTDPGGRLYANMREFDETPEEYGERILKDIGENPDKYFQRGPIVRTQAEERDAAKDAWELARQIRDAQLEHRWPRNPDACDAYGSFCQYFPVCAGETTIEDPIRYRESDREHEDLSKSADAIVATSKRKLPILSASSMKSFRSCPRKYFFAYEMRRRSLAESDALRFGTLMHKALEIWWKTVDINAALAAIASNEKDPFERVKATMLMRGYHARWIDEPFDVLAVEEEFVAPLVNPESGRESQTWQRGGKIDAIVRVTPRAPVVEDASLHATEAA